MRNKLSKLAMFLLLASVSAFSQTTTTITGTIRDLSQALVTSGKVTFALQPSRDTTISGYARFSPQTITCAINASGSIKAQDGVSVCTLTMNTALQPTGTYYLVKVWPANVATSTFTFYAVLSTYDWSTVVPTPTTSPAQNFVDIFSNQSLGGNKTFLGNTTFSGSITGPLNINGFTTTIGEQIQVSGSGCGTTLDLFNTDASPTNPHKYFRVNQSTGALELMSSGCVLLASIDETSQLSARTLSFHNMQVGINKAGGMTFIIDAGVTAGGDYNFTSGAGGIGNNNSGNYVFNAGTPTGSGVQGTIQTNTTVSKYSNINTVGNGVPAEYATVDLTAQAAAVTTTTLYMAPGTGAGQYRLAWNSKVTTVATTSCQLGALTIVYTDPDGVVQTITAGAQIPAGTVATNSTVNTTANVLLGLPMMLNVKAATAITYAFAYASVGGTAMQYNLHIRLEAL